jgi:hypothetical protein
LYLRCGGKEERCKIRVGVPSSKQSKYTCGSASSSTAWQ